MGSANPNVSMESVITPRIKKSKKKKVASPTTDIDLQSLALKIGSNEEQKSEEVTKDNALDIELSDNEFNGGCMQQKHGTKQQINGGFTEDPLSIIVASWNVSESEVNFANLSTNFIPSSRVEPYDLYVIGLQECAQSLRKQWISSILRHIDGNSNEYVLLNKAWLLGMGILIIVHRTHLCKISHLHSQCVPTGKGNIIGNKGATAISFQLQETSFVFINAHLAARLRSLKKERKISIESSKISSWVGRDLMCCTNLRTRFFWAT